MKWDGRGRLREREYSAPWFCAVKKNNDQESLQQKPLEWEHNNARHRESNAECARSRRLDDITIESIKDLEPRNYSFQWRNCCSCATNIGLDSSRISELFQDQLSFCCDKDQIQISVQVFRCTPRISLLPPPPLDGLLTDSTNYGCEWCPHKLSQLE